MSQENNSPTLTGLTIALADTLDGVSPVTADLNRRTAYIAVRLGEEMGLRGQELRDLLLAALLRDIGLFSLADRQAILNFDLYQPHRHAFRGSNLLAGFQPLAEVARIIRGHHLWWRLGRDTEVGGSQAPLASYIIHLADRMAILMGQNGDVLNRAVEILDRVAGLMGSMFMPDLMPALLRTAQDDSFWYRAVRPDLEDHMKISQEEDPSELTERTLDSLAGVLARIVDYRSHYTASHSASVSAVGVALAKRLGFSSQNCRKMRTACHLHDLGKLAVPVEILEKPGSLTDQERRVIQQHPVHTRSLLERLPDLSYGVTWAAQHHERMDGSGYPSHAIGQKISFGSRVLAVADMFTAITEERPHRRRMSKEDSMRKLRGLTYLDILDQEVLHTACDHFEEIHHIRTQSQFDALKRYENMVGIVGGGL